MKKLKAISTPVRIILVLLIGLLVWFFFLPKADKFEFIGAILFTVLTTEAAWRLIPDSWFKPFKRKERNPLLEE
jgi:hypothetical protein